MEREERCENWEPPTMLISPLVGLLRRVRGGGSLFLVIIFQVSGFCDVFWLLLKGMCIEFDIEFCIEIVVYILCQIVYRVVNERGYIWETETEKRDVRTKNARFFRIFPMVGLLRRVRGVLCSRFLVFGFWFLVFCCFYFLCCWLVYKFCGKFGVYFL